MLYKLRDGATIRVRDSGAIEYRDGVRTLRMKMPDRPSAVEWLRHTMWGPEIRYSQSR
jgi:hypothetical protein